MRGLRPSVTRFRPGRRVIVRRPGAGVVRGGEVRSGDGFRISRT